MKKSNVRQKTPSSATVRTPILAKIILPYYVLSYVIGVALFFDSIYNPLLYSLLGIAALLFVFLFLFHKPYVLETRHGRKLLNSSAAYWITAITIFFYTLAMVRSDQLNLYTTAIICAASLLVYYSIFVNMDKILKKDA